MACLPEPPTLRGRRLSELLREQQEPFLLDVYLLENGYSDRLLLSQSSSVCWPGNACKRLRRSTSHGFKRTRAGLLRSVLKLFGGMSNWKTLKSEDSEAPPENRWKDMKVDDESVQLSPVSVLELHSREGSPVHHIQDLEEKVKLTSDFELQTKALDIFKELLQLAYTPAFNELTKSKIDLDQQEKLSFGSDKHEPEKKLDSLDCSNFTMAANGEPEKQEEDFTSIDQLIISELSDLSWRDWKHYKPELREIGIQIEAAIFEDFREELVLEMLAKPSCISDGY